MKRLTGMKMLSPKSLLLLLCTLALQSLAFDIPTAPSGDAKPAKVKAKPSATTPSSAPTPIAVVSGPSGKLVIEVDADCELRVNGEKRQSMKMGEPKVVSLEAGEQLLECISTENSEAKVRKVQTVEAGKQAVLALSLASAVSDAAAKAETQAKLKRDAAKFRDGANTIIEPKSGLQWTQSDNGSEISWTEANAYCKAIGTGWDLPAVAQLQALVDTTQSQSCGTKTCSVSPKFRLTEVFFWSNEREGSSQAWYVHLNGGGRYAYHVENRNYKRALCVRRP